MMNLTYKMTLLSVLAARQILLLSTAVLNISEDSYNDH
jgi:hypothetical protein